MASEKTGRAKVKSPMAKAHDLLRDLGFTGCGSDKELFISTRTVVQLKASEIEYIEDDFELVQLIIAKLEFLKEKAEANLLLKIDYLLSL